jgi:hypothetical protein
MFIARSFWKVNRCRCGMLAVSLLTERRDFGYRGSINIVSLRDEELVRATRSVAGGTPAVPVKRLSCTLQRLSHTNQ